MTQRSKRLEKFLSDALGWETHSERWKCTSCLHSTGYNAAFCECCGKKMKLDNSDRKTVEADLEEAIKYALGERKKL